MQNQVAGNLTDLQGKHTVPETEILLSCGARTLLQHLERRLEGLRLDAKYFLRIIMPSIKSAVTTLSCSEDLQLFTKCI